MFAHIKAFPQYLEHSKQPIKCQLLLLLLMVNLTKERKKCGHKMVSEAAQCVAGDGVVTTKQLAHLTLADLAMSTGVYCTQGYEGLEFVSILSMAWQGHHLSPHQNGFHSHPFSSKCSLFFTRFESCHVPCPRSLPTQTLGALYVFPELIWVLLSEPKVRPPHTCCKTQTGVTRPTFPQATEKWLWEGRRHMASSLGSWASRPPSWA